MAEPTFLQTWEHLIDAIAESGDIWLLILILIIILSFKYVIAPSVEIFRETVTYYNTRLADMVHNLTHEINDMSQELKNANSALTKLETKIDQILTELRYQNRPERLG